MGMIEKLLTFVFGGGGKALTETAQVFRVHAENQAGRDAQSQKQALDQFAAEFKQAQRGGFDRFMDGLNRVPRPAMALGTLGLFTAAMVDPVWFAERMAGIALVPQPLWWLLGAIVSFYFGARHQTKGQDFQRDLARSMAAVPGVLDNLREIRAFADEDADEHRDRDEGGASAASADDATAGPRSRGGQATPQDLTGQRTEPTLARTEANAALADWRDMQAARPATM